MICKRELIRCRKGSLMKVPQSAMAFKTTSFAERWECMHLYQTHLRNMLGILKNNWQPNLLPLEFDKVHFLVYSLVSDTFQTKSCSGFWDLPNWSKIKDGQIVTDEKIHNIRVSLIPQYSSFPNSSLLKLMKLKVVKIFPVHKDM